MYSELYILVNSINKDPNPTYTIKTLIIGISNPKKGLIWTWQLTQKWWVYEMQTLLVPVDLVELLSNLGEISANLVGISPIMENILPNLVEISLHLLNEAWTTYGGIKVQWRTVVSMEFNKLVSLGFQMGKTCQFTRDYWVLTVRTRHRPSICTEWWS